MIRNMVKLTLVAGLGIGTSVYGCAKATETGAAKTDAGTGTGGTTDAGTGTTGTPDSTGTTGTPDSTGTTTGTPDSTGTTTGTPDSTGTTTGSDDGTGTTTGDDGGGGTTTGVVDNCKDTEKYSKSTGHIVKLFAPNAAEDYKCDSNGDKTVDKADGSLNDFLVGPLISGFIKVNDTLKESVDKGTLNFLLDLHCYEAGKDGTNIRTDLLVGKDKDKQVDPTCSDLDGKTMCEYYVDPKSYDNQGKALLSVPNSTVTAGHLSGGPGDFSFSFPISDGLAIALEVKEGRFEADVSGSVAATNGRICGKVSKQQLLDGLKAACDSPTAPSFCGTVKPLLGTLGGLIKCDGDVCTVVLGYDAVPTKGLKDAPQ